MSTTRRAALGRLGAGAVLLAVPGAQAAPRRPNILWISCEDTSQTLGCYGDPLARTPNLDRLATQGVRYTHAFSIFGVCAPSRSSIITGLHPDALGSCHMRSRITLPAGVRCWPEYLRRAGYWCTNNVKTDYNFAHPRETWDECSGKAHWRGRAKDQPFFAVFNITATHEGQFRQRGAAYERLVAGLSPAERQDPARQRVPAYLPDTPEVRRDLAQRAEMVTVMDQRVGELLAQLEADGLADNTIVCYWGDHGSGLTRGKRWPYDSGTRVPLIVRVPAALRTGDQGRPGSVDSQLVTLMDLGPTVLNLAGVRWEGPCHGRAFLGPNLGPPRAFVPNARDRMDERYETIRSLRDQRWRYVRHCRPDLPYFQHVNYAEVNPAMQELRRLHAAGGLPRAAAQFMADTKPREELYDLETDPDEVRNLASDPAQAPRLAAFRAELRRWQLEVRDVGMLPECEMQQRVAQAGSQWDILRRDEQLLPRVLDAAELVGAGPAAEPRLRAALADPDAAVRWWAVVGLAALGQQTATLRAAAKDPAASVRLAAAAGLVREGLAAEALALVKPELGSDNPYLRLAAAHVLEGLAPRHAEVRDALRTLRDDPNEYVKRIVASGLAAERGAR